MNNFYFTIQTIKGSGLGDQLGTQFSRLFGLGKALGASFYYTPISFQRSVKPRWYELSQSILFRTRYFLFFNFGQNLFSNAVNAIFLLIEKRLNTLLENYEDKKLSVFLGLKYISDEDPVLIVNRSFCDIYIDDFLESKESTEISDFRQYVDSIIKKRNDNPILRLVWTGKMWALIPKIDQILYKAELDKDVILQSVFTTGFWKQNIPIFTDKTNIVFHIRCGDSTTVHLGERALIVYDKFLYESEKEMTEILKIDPDRISVLPEEYIHVYDQIINKVGVEKTTLTVVSDGYELTYRNILRNLLKRKCQIRLTNNERKILAFKMKELNNVFNHFHQSRLILGESKQNLQDSIYALANANVVIWGCGGFACNTHNLFKAVDGKSIVINVKEFSDLDINHLNKLING